MPDQKALGSRPAMVGVLFDKLFCCNIQIFGNIASFSQAYARLIAATASPATQTNEIRGTLIVGRLYATIHREQFNIFKIFILVLLLKLR